MKKISVLALLIQVSVLITNAQSVAINNDGTIANSSAILDVKSTTKGMLSPRMTSAQRSAIVSPANGLIVYDTDTKTFWFYNGTTWINLTGSGSGSLTLPFDGSVASSGTAFKINNTNGTAIEGYGTNGSGLYGYSSSAAGINAMSTNGFGIIANSVNSGAIYAYNTNAAATIKATNTTGVGINATSTANHGILATTSGVSKSGVRGEASVSGSDGVMGLNTAGGVGVRAEAGTGTGLSAYSNTGTGAYAYSNSGTALYATSPSGIALNLNGNVKIAGGNTNPSNGAVLTSDASGNAVWKNNKIAFGIQGANSNFSSVPHATFRKVQFGPTGYYDLGNNFNLLVGTNLTPTSSAFIAPVAGVYHFDAMAALFTTETVITDMSVRLVINRNGNISFVHGITSYKIEGDLSDANSSVSRDLYLMPGDIVHVEVFQFNNDEINVIYGSSVFFNGHLVVAQ